MVSHALDISVNRVISWLMRHPRLLMALAGLLGVILVALSLQQPLASLASHQGETGMAAEHASRTAPASSQVAPPLEREQAVIAVIAGYNQASITAGLLGKPDVLAAYLAADGPAWQAVQSEYAHRYARGELHDAALTRWGIMQIATTDTTARVVTQEQWDVVTRIGAQVIASRRGVLVQNSYEMRYAPQVGWQIVTIETTTLIA